MYFSVLKYYIIIIVSKHWLQYQIDIQYKVGSIYKSTNQFFSKLITKNKIVKEQYFFIQMYHSVVYA